MRSERRLAGLGSRSRRRWFEFYGPELEGGGQRGFRFSRGPSAAPAPVSDKARRGQGVKGSYKGRTLMISLGLRALGGQEGTRWVKGSAERAGSEG